MATTLQNFYKSTLTANSTATTGNIYVGTKPTTSSGWLVISPNNATLREIITYTSTGTDGSGDYVVASARGVGGTTAQTHTTGEPIRMNLTAEHWAEMNATIAAIIAAGAPDANETTKGLFEEATDAQVTAGTAVGETGAKNAITPAKLLTYLRTNGGQNIIKSLTAAEDITAGLPVGVSEALTGYVSRSLRAASSAASGISTPVTTVESTTHGCPIGGDKFVYLTHTAAGSDTLFAQVGQVATATKTLTLGTAATVATAITPNSGNTYTVAKLDTDKFIVFYLLDSSTTDIKYRVGTVSGTTITFGTEANLVVAASAVGAGYFSADFLSTDKFTFTYKTTTETNGRTLVGTTSGTVATAGTPVAIGANTDAVNITATRKIGTDKYVIVCHDTTNSIYGQVCTVSGTTVTAGSEVQLSTTTSSPSALNFDVISPDTDAFVVHFRYDNNAFNLVAATVSGTVITAGTALSNNTLGNSQLNVGMFATSSTNLYVMTSTRYIYRVTRSGSTLTISGIISNVFSSTSIGKTLSLDNGDFAAIRLGSTNLDCWVYGMSNNFIGIAQSTVSKGASVNVLIRGVDSNQSSLNPGMYYQVSSGAFSAIANNATASTTATQAYVKAISTTEVIL